MAGGAGTSESPVYDATVTETALVSVTEVSLTPYSSGVDVTYSETAAPNGLINYAVENGTTYWLKGQTPNPSETYILMTSVVTVLPVPSSVSNSNETLTPTLQTTIYTRVTFTEALSLKHSSAPTSMAYGAPLIGTGPSFTGMASGGWNATSTVPAKAVVGTAAVGFSPFSTSVTLAISKSSLDIYHTKSAQPSITIETLSAESGFIAYTTFAKPASTLSSSSPGDAGNSTTLIRNGQTFTLSGSATAVDAASSLPPYANTTISLASTLSNATSDGIGIATPLGVTSSPALSFIPLSSSVLSSISTAGLTNYTTLTAPTYSSQLTTHATTPTVVTSSNSPTSVSTASATPSTCGELGDFTLDVSTINLD